MAVETEQQRVLDVAARARQIRISALRMVYRAGKGHIGGDLSCADILAALYFGVLRIDPARPKDPGRDRFVMSKGHASASLYSALALSGFLPPSQLATYMQPGSRLSGHPSCLDVPGVEASTGSLGHGLPIAVGMAIGAKLKRERWRVFVLLGDGELQEGSNWEAAMLAGHRQLDNLTAIIDHNGLQQGDLVSNTVTLQPLADKWRAFGWSVTEVDGHDIAALLQILGSVPLTSSKPTCVIARTCKGKGVSFMEGQVDWHHRVPTRDEFEAAMRELGGAEG